MKSMAQVLDSIPIGVFLVTQRMEVVHWNPCMEDWTGITCDEIVGKPLTQFYPVFLKERYAERLRFIFSLGTPVLLTYRLHGNLFPNRDPSCIERVYQTTATRFKGDESYALFTLEDRTEVSNRIKEAREELSKRIETEKLLRAALEEKDILFREIHHRVKNNLNTIVSLIHLQQDAIEDDSARKHLDGIEARIQSFALLHETLYRKDVYDSIDAADYLRSVSDRLLESSAVVGVNFRLDLVSVIMPVKRTIYLGLVFVELITNAFKYGVSSDGMTRIEASLEQAGKGVCRLRVKDSGQGIPSDATTGTEGSLGIRLIIMMAEELDGTVSYEMPKEGGTVATIEFSTGSVQNV